MCGFIGRIHTPAGPAVHKKPLTAGLGFLNRRGPDSAGEWKSQDGRVELLHTRLAIVDKDSRAHQPLTDAERNITVAFIGEIYNYQSLRSELDGYPFHTASDTEVILAMAALRGPEGMKKFRGMFSIVLVDERSKKIHLLRDPIGKKPLFLAHWPGGVYFGSTALSMASAAGVGCDRLDEGSREDFWKKDYVSPQRSIFKDCVPVAPGEVIELDWEGKIRERTYCGSENKIFPASLDLPQVRERISHLIGQSVKRRLQDNPKPVCLLSGGVDSTVVASHMKRLGALSALTIGSVIPMRHDEKYARTAARRLGMELQIVKPPKQRFADEVSWVLDLQDEPLGMMSFFALAELVKAAKPYGRILITGDGGDEIFFGYGRPADWIADSKDPYPGWMSPWGREMAGPSLIGHMFTKLDRASAEQGVEARSPLLDFDLVEFVKSLPPDVLFHKGRTKAVLKAELEDWPGWFVERKKMGFPYPLRWLWAAEKFSGLRELVSEESIRLFSSFLASDLRKPSKKWGYWTIFKNFSSIWKLLSWSAFERRLRKAPAGGPE